MKSIYILQIILVFYATKVLATANTVSPATYSNNCEHFLGSWHSETYNRKGKYTNVQTATYDSEGKLTLKIIIQAEDGTIYIQPEVVRDWYCDGNIYITRNDPNLEAQDENPANGPRFKVYRLLGTTPNKIRYRTIVGHTPGVVFTLERQAIDKK
ncbi:MAG: hypothetical protein AB2689_01165 [Candidatus Thiodiazotropha taylori]